MAGFSSAHVMGFVVGEAKVRVRWQVTLLAISGIAGVPVPAVLLVMLVALGVYDLVVLGRLHRATMWSSLLVAMATGGPLMVAGTATGPAIIEALR